MQNPAQASSTFSTLTEAEFPQHTITNAAGVRISVLANGCLQHITAGHHMVNLFVGHPLGGGPMRLLLRRLDTTPTSTPEPTASGPGFPFTELIGPSSTATLAASTNALRWSGTWDTLHYTVDLTLHKSQPAWAWRITLTHKDASHADAESTKRLVSNYDAILVQDVGIASRGQIQNNEAYTSQYIDHQIFDHATLGKVVAARQNLPQQDKQHPWLMHACVDGCVGALTDAFDFFGPGFRAGGAPALIAETTLPTRRRQYEFSCHTLQSQPVSLAAGQSKTVTFVARLVEHHPAVSSAADLALLDDVADAATWEAAGPLSAFGDANPLPLPPLVNGLPLGEDEIADNFGEPDEHRHLETLGGATASFFGEDGQHVVLQSKEFAVDRRHAHLLMAGDDRLPGGETLCSTGYMQGVFASHVCLGNTSFNKLFSVSRDPLNLHRYSGLRLFIREPGASEWQQLGVASACDMGLHDCVWVYKISDSRTLTVTATALTTEAVPEAVSGGRRSGSPSLQYKVKVEGDPLDIRLTAHLVVGDREHDQACNVAISPGNQRIVLNPLSGLIKDRYPNTAWWITFDEEMAKAGNDELLYGDGIRRGLPYFVAESHNTHSIGWTIKGFLPEVASGQHELHDRVHADATTGVPALEHPKNKGVSRLSDALPWFAQNAAIHLAAPHGIEQYGGAAWGVRDVCQGPVEWLLGVGENATVKRILEDVFTHQYEQRGDWPQWYMHSPFETIQSDHCHGDVAVWPIIATVNYLEATNDFSLLDTETPFTADQGFGITQRTATIREHLALAISKLKEKFVPGTSLLRFGDGDWNDSLQPAQPAMRDQMISTWTVELFYQALRRFADALRRTDKPGDADAAEQHDATADAIRRDFERLLMPDGITAGLFLHDEADGDSGGRPLLHPRDGETGVKYRLLPMNDGILSGIFTATEAARHLELIEKHLLAPDGARLMNESPRYSGGLMKYFQRAESASFFGREIGLMYVHAHLRYCEAMMKLGKADAAFKGLLAVNPIGLQETVPNAMPRQANCYFSSSDGDFENRADSEQRYDALKRGEVGAHGGWRVYSSGPGIYVGLITRKWLGLRREFDTFVIDPVLPASLDGMRASLIIEGVETTVTFRVGSKGNGVSSVEVNGSQLSPTGREENPYREGGLRFEADAFIAALSAADEAEVVVTLG